MEKEKVRGLKDILGKQVYEGDILKGGYKEDLIVKVRWNTKMFRWEFDRIDGWHWIAIGHLPFNEFKIVKSEKHKE